MAIIVCGDKINFGSKCIQVQPGGIYIAGRFDSAGCALVNTPEMGSSFGFVSGGLQPGPEGGGPLSITPNINRFPFSSDSNATDVGQLSCCVRNAAHFSSPVSGYLAGGERSPAPAVDFIQKFNFPSGAPVADVGEMSETKYGAKGTSSATHGYIAGSYYAAPGAADSNKIEKTPFAADSPSTPVATLTLARGNGATQSSYTHGYLTGGRERNPPGQCSDRMDRWPFATDTPATDVGELPFANASGVGTSSQTYGYLTGGVTSPSDPAATGGVSIVRKKFPFASESTVTDSGSTGASGSIILAAGNSSTISGYFSGGYCDGSIRSCGIKKHSFENDTDATDVGCLTGKFTFVGGNSV
jgi:hypothetical protein